MLVVSCRSGRARRTHFLTAAMTSSVSRLPSSILAQLADVVLRLLEQVEQRGDRLAVDLGGLSSGRPSIRDAVDAAVLVVAVGVAQVVLHVADDRVVPVGEVDRAVRTDVDAGGAEVRIARMRPGARAFSPLSPEPSSRHLRRDRCPGSR